MNEEIEVTFYNKTLDKKVVIDISPDEDDAIKIDVNVADDDEGYHIGLASILLDELTK